MDLTKKRKLEEDGDSESTLPKLSPEDARKLIERFSTDQLLDVLKGAITCHSDVLDAVRSVADPDISQRKLFIRGLGLDTTTDGIRALFSAYGELEEAIVIVDKATGKSKGYGFVTFKHVDAAFLALKEPSKTIDGRVTVTQLAAAGNTGSASTVADVSLRKIYVSIVPGDIPADKLLAHFSLYGEIEEGPLGFDKQTGKCRGYALFVYKNPEGAQGALVEPIKTVEGWRLTCKLAKGRSGGSAAGVTSGIQTPMGGQGTMHGNGMGMAPPSSMPGSFGGQYGVTAGMGSYGGFSSGIQGLPHPLNSSLGGPGLSSVGSQAPSSIGGSGGYGAGLGGPYGSGYGGQGSGGYGSFSSTGGLGGGSGGFAGAGGASSMYRMPPGSAGGQSVGYPDGGHYGLSSSSGYQNQQHHPAGTSPVPRVPPGGMYPNVPPYY